MPIIREYSQKEDSYHLESSISNLLSIANIDKNIKFMLNNLFDSSCNLFIHQFYFCFNKYFPLSATKNLNTKYIYWNNLEIKYACKKKLYEV